MQDKQRGITFLGLVIVLILIGFFSYVTMRLAPLYFENYGVKGSLDSLVSDPAFYTLSGDELKAKIRDHLWKRLRVNNVDNVTLEQIKIQMVEQGVRVRVVYNARTHLMGNIDALLTFDDQVVVPRK